MILLEDELPGPLPIGQVNFKTVTCLARKSTSPGIPCGPYFEPWPETFLKKREDLYAAL